MVMAINAFICSSIAFAIGTLSLVISNANGKRGFVYTCIVPVTICHMLHDAIASLPASVPSKIYS